VSRFGALEASCLAQLETVSGFSETRAVAAGLLMNGTPSAYPAGWLAVVAAKNVSQITPTAGHTSYEYDIELGIVIFANSDGINIGDARVSAWTLQDGVFDAFTNFVPTGLPALTTVWPVRPKDPQNVITDTGINAIYIPLTCKIAWTM
jgi:hypothetical protein